MGCERAKESKSKRKKRKTINPRTKRGFIRLGLDE
jgi:hypothetical protein